MNRADGKLLPSLAARAKKWGPSATLPAASYRALTLRPAAALPHFLPARSRSKQYAPSPGQHQPCRALRHVAIDETLENHSLKP